MSSSWGNSWSASWGNAWGVSGPVIEMPRRLLVTSLDGLQHDRGVPLDGLYRPIVALDGLYTPKEPQ
ncbi:MAG: hypothetical protein EOQ52_20420 [Mesorhizobium sp.]|uniref:hypothetical protein n=1 Tax=Mesorhizobium sp. TaxID=1871066 RepID=UPI000FE5EB71|nr:hypothetical protein [Mesorhizobium sp.]RWB85919.1 MAG: hypothetical protein EOQ52_20420 [Mesorhizobium sp.]